MSSLCLRSGASMIFRRQKESDSTSNGCPVVSEIRFQCLSFIALLVIISNSGQDSLKSSILFLRSKNACQSLSPLGSLRHLSLKEMEHFTILNLKCVNILTGGKTISSFLRRKTSKSFPKNKCISCLGSDRLKEQVL